MRWWLASQLNSTLRLFGLKSVASQFLAAFLIICLLAGSTVTTLYLSLSASADTINMAGRQRMLSQKMAKEAMMVAQGVEQRAVLEKTINLFASSHEKLLRGDSSAGIAAPATAAVG